jgi:hypothetical protein
LAYEDMTNEKTWEDINQMKYHGKKYIFLCWKVFRGYWLVDWKLLEENGKEK